MDTSSFGVFVFWNHMDTTLGQFLQENTWVKLLVHDVLELWLVHLNELNEEWVDLNIKSNSLGDNSQQSYLLLDGSQRPGVIREVGAL